MIATTLGFALILAASAPSGNVASAPQRPRITFDQVLQREDANKDRRVTRGEFKGPPQLFDRLDRNGDGVLTEGDFSVGPAPQRRERQSFNVPDDVEVIRDVTFGKGGGRDLKMHIVLPKQRSKDPMPIFVWIHGGGWQGGTKEGGLAQLVHLARHGIAGATIEYRLSGEATFPAQIEDCKCAVRFLREKAGQYNIDPERFAVGGSSAGGHLAALVGTSGGVADLEGTGGWPEQSSRVQAVIDLYGPTDFAQFVKTPGYESHARPGSPESRLLGGEVLKLSDKVQRVNPITYIDANDPPFLIIHGGKDKTVPPNQSESIFKALQKAGVESRLRMIEKAGHGGPEFATPELRELQRDFLVRELRSK